MPHANAREGARNDVAETREATRRTERMMEVGKEEGGIAKENDDRRHALRRPTVPQV
jgi:hypothetical protein